MQTTTTPKITIKNLKVAEFASEETLCYEATVYLNGKRFCSARNDGHGGSDYYWPIKPFTQKDIDELEKQLALESFEYHGMTLQHSLETRLGEVIEETRFLKRVKTKMRKSTLVVKDGKMYSINRSYTPEFGALLEKRGDKPLNPMSDAELLEIFKSTEA